MKRPEVLAQAHDAVTRDRQNDHGPPENTFALIAEFWSTYLGIPVAPYDVALMMALFKIARGCKNHHHDDNAVDGCGYLAIAAELAEGEVVDA